VAPTRLRSSFIYLANAVNDLNGDWARRALQAGARFTVSSDAHSVKNFDFMQFGVGSARRGWLTAADVLNTRPLDELRAILHRRRSSSNPEPQTPNP